MITLPLNTARLRLTELNHNFAQEILNSNTGNVRDYFIPFENIDEVTEWIDEYKKLKAKSEKLELVITEKSNNELIGMVALDNLLTDRPEIRLWIAKKYQNQGYAKEACEVYCNQFKKQNPNKRIIYRADKKNISSNKLAISLGFTLVKEYIDEDGSSVIEYTF